ncbi:hypothetical protein [Kitasatospora sp. NPDC057198]|uniref:hypothetical protein n=1 Tax=Kitasatospora sp. NPDC057198 TaxID=3346046 RepID=UPI003624BC96
MSDSAPDTPPTLEQLLQLIRKDTGIITRYEKALATMEERRSGRMTAARAAGATADELAEIIGKSATRVKQLAPGGKHGRPRKAAPAPAPAPAAEEPDPERLPAAYRTAVPDELLPERWRPGAATGLRSLLSDLVTNRWGIKGPEKATIFLDMATGRWVSVRGATGQLAWSDRSAAELLAGIPEPVERVFLVGNRPQAPGIPDAAEAVRAWFLGPVPPGWAGGSHYLENADLPTGRWTHASEREVEVLRAACWFGTGEYSADQAAAAWAELRGMIARKFDSGALLLSTPSTTGRDLFRRSIGTDRRGKPKTYPVLSAELRELIQSTSGQGRWEVLPEGPQEIPVFTHWDMRFAYSALAWGMPVGAPTMVTGKEWAALTDEDQDVTLMRRGRWLVTAEVPAGWEHVGLLGAPAETSGDEKLWTYPRRPGERFTTWASGSELSLARQWKWRIQVHEGFHFKEGKPLNDWKTNLTELYLYTENRDDISPDLRRLVQGALRMLVLTSVGAFAARSHPVTKSIPATRQNRKVPPEDAPVRVVGGHYVWTELGERSHWSQLTDHPEWSAEIWARCRARLLEAPTADKSVRAGALHVPPGTVLAMRTDGISLACDPGWTDDGTVGLYRLKGRIGHAVARPVNEAEGESLRKLAAQQLGAA